MCKLNDQVEVDTIVVSDWMKGWRYFYTPIQSKVKKKLVQSGITFDTHVKSVQKTVYIGMPH